MWDLPSALVFLLAAAAPQAVVATDGLGTTTTTTTSVPACTATASTGLGGYFDLRPDIALAAEKDAKPKKGVRTTDYVARGYEYNYNFTLNICTSVVKPIEDVVGVKESLWANVSAYYTQDGRAYSIGQESMDLRSRGRKLVLQYTGGSPCGEGNSKRGQKRAPGSVHPGASYKYSDYSDETENELRANDGGKGGSDGDIRRKSTIISFLCDSSQLAAEASISFVGTDPDECAYFFEARSVHACVSAEPHKPGSIGPGGIFLLIFVIALLVYFMGGVFYQRTVGNARGWRQLPNYTLWAGIWSFVSDMVIIIASSCAQLVPARRGYHQLSRSPPPGRGRTRDDENRLIDQLDEEWDD